MQDVFFYGLYMDPTLIQSKGAIPRKQRMAKVENHALRVGKMATLLRQKGATTPGVIYALTHQEIDRLYRDAGLLQYAPEALIAELPSGERIPVLCCTLRTPPEPDETNEAYALKLDSLKTSLGLS
ncbi:MAG TPA: gamma-glutamylcyclotransferase family protein [Fibrobacteria bacterium]|nr:gamma-glutamylcyclotransferase family protein [Fibrobacteria bacterium]